MPELFKSAGKTLPGTVECWGVMSSSRVGNCDSSALHTSLCRQQLGKREADGSPVLLHP